MSGIPFLPGTSAPTLASETGRVRIGTPPKSRRRGTVTQRGFLLLLDLSGYTEFMTQADLEQAPGILQSLLGTLAQHIRPPLAIAELEGDAIFAWAPDDGFTRGETLIERIESLYCEFAAAREQMERNAACDCTGCSLFPLLDLKIVAHHGSFALRRMLPGQPAKPVGADVIVAHRLLKNRIVATTGVRAYAFITQACVEALELEAIAQRAVPHVEHYEHIGTVLGYVFDLAPVWAVEREKRLVRVDADNAWIEVAATVNADPHATWDLVSGNAYRSLWRDPERNGAGESGETRQSCYTGAAVVTQTVADWRPPEQLTFECEWPIGARVLITTELVPCADGTSVVTRVGWPQASIPAPAVFVRSYYRLRTSRIERLCRDNLALLGTWVRREQSHAATLPIVRPEARPST